MFPTVTSNWINLASKKHLKIATFIQFPQLTFNFIVFHRISSLLDGGWEMRGCHACDISVSGEGLEASAQGLLTACFHGLGPIIGLLGGGVLFDTLGGHTSYLVFALGVTLSCAGQCWANHQQMISDASKLKIERVKHQRNGNRLKRDENQTASAFGQTNQQFGSPARDEPWKLGNPD